MPRRDHDCDPSPSTLSHDLADLDPTTDPELHGTPHMDHSDGHPSNLGPPVFRRVLLKLSGESFCRPGEGGISVEEVSRIARAGLAGGLARGRAGDRRRRREHPPGRHAGARPGRHPGIHRPLHGHDRHGHQRPGLAGRPGAPRLRDPADDHHPHGGGRRAVHPPPGPDPPGPRPGRSSWPPAPAARSSPPTRPPRCGARSWASRC